ncbi:hypothetical protein Plec18170_002722 [Paecilomyces lecythidis]
MAPFDQESFQKEIEKVRLSRIKAHLRCKKLRARKRRLERKKYRIESFSKGAKKHQNPKPTPDRGPAQEKPPRIPRQKATVKQLAESSRRLPLTGLEVEEHILNKIKKCLQRASDPSTTEDEAKAALYISSKLMSHMATEERKKEQEAAHKAELARLAEREQEEMEQREREIARLNKSVPDESFQVLIDNSEKSIIKCDSDSEGYTSEPDFVEDEGGQGKCFNSEVDLEEEITRLLNRSSESTGSQKRAINDQKTRWHHAIQSIQMTNLPRLLPRRPFLNACGSLKCNLFSSVRMQTKLRMLFLKEQNIRLGTGKKNYTTVKDHIAYEEGREDSKKIDFQQRRIEEAPN